MGGAHSTHGSYENAYKFSVGEPEGKKPFGGFKPRWKDNFRMGLREIWLEDVDWIHLAQDR
jgi:hypothetical protein